MKLSTSRALVAGAAVCNLALAIEPPRQPHQPSPNGTKILTWNDTMVDSPFGYDSTSVSWISGDEDGQYIYQDDDGALVLENFVTGDSETFVAADAIPEDMYEYWIRPDFAKVLFATNYTKQYRHSYFANYQVLDVASGETTQLVDDQQGDVQYAEFAPSGDAIAFIRNNDLFLNKNGTISQITENGSPDMFNAVPDWVYEEEIFGSRSTLWWSPDSEALAFLSFNETGVQTYTVEFYMDNQKVAPVYPKELELRYPKVGTKNPVVSLSILMMESGELKDVPITAYEADNLVVGELAWVAEEHTALIYRAFNRVQDMSKHVRVDVGDEKISSEVIRERDGTDGWLDNTLSMQYVGKLNETEYYLDVSDESGWNHIYLYPTDGSNGTALTSGEWEVVEITHVDPDKELVYFTSTKGDSTERHLFSVNYQSTEMTALVDVSVPAYWSASFSTGGGYYILSYQGPDVPYQELYSTNSTEPLRTITSNEALYETLQSYNLPEITYFTLAHPSGFDLNVMQRLPPNFSPDKKYPVLFTPYGGPGAQEITKAFLTPDWNAYISSDPELEYITYTVDNRGSGYQGRAMRATVASHLGDFEAADQIWAASQLTAKNEFLDVDHVGIFGWSYGGYLSSKVVERDGGEVFSHALIVAPVSDWRFYDSCYTERYMKTPATNGAGYNETAVRDPQGFKTIPGGVSIMHGTGDDNVHFQNTAALIDLLVGAGVSPEVLEWRAFTDSDHGISYDNAGTYLYKHMTGRLYAEKMRTGEGMGHQWSRKGEEELFE